MVGVNRIMRVWKLFIQSTMFNYIPVFVRHSCHMTWPFDFDIMIGWIGGQFGWEMSAAGPDAAVDFALEELVKMVGSNARKHFVKGHLTGWANNPGTLGAYAAATPGHYVARADLAKPLAEQLFFAGEAVAGPYKMLCSGAYMSGEVVANDVAAVIR